MNRMTEEKVLVQIWIVLLAKVFHPGSPQVNMGRKSQEKMKGGIVEIEADREKERNRRSERDKGDFDTSNRPGQDNISKDMPVFKEDVRHKGQPKTLVPDA